jgi:hypothetical protein
MVRKKQADKTELITDILVKMEAALAEVFGYYKLGRHQGAFWGQPYFLLSYCTRLMHSLWLINEDSGRTIFREGACPAGLLTSLDFESLHHMDDASCLLPPDSSQDPLKNEPQWFSSWMQILDGLRYPGSPDSQEFCHQVLISAGCRAFLDGEMQRRNRRTIQRVVKTDLVGRVLLRSMSVLRDAIWAMTHYLATLDSRTYFPEQVRALTCLLSQIRRTIVYETPATGPYVPSNAKGWGLPSLLGRLYFGKTRGVLRVVLRREGGGVICTYSWISGAGPNSRSWTCSLSALKGTYEESLFGTWAYETGECRHDGAGPSGEPASWIIQSAEAGLLGSISRYVEALLRALSANPICSSMVEAVAGIVRNSGTRGKRSALPWTYVKQLDQVLEQLKSVYRAAAVPGEHNSAEQLVKETWPVRHIQARWTYRQRSENLSDEVANRADTHPDDNVSATVGESAVRSPAGAEPADRSQSPLPDEAVASSSPAMQKPAGERVPDDPVSQDGDNRTAECLAEKAQEPSDASQSNVAGEVRPTADGLTAARDAAGCPAASRGPEDLDAKKGSGTADLIADASRPRTLQETTARADAAPEQEPSEMYTPLEASRDVVPIEQPADSAGGAGGHKGRATTVVSEEDDEGQPIDTTDMPDGISRTPVDSPLLRKLLKHHRCRSARIKYTPVSLTKLQRDLAWSRSKVQRAMAELFGCQPFNVYKKKCEDHTILAFLEARRFILPGCR